MVLRQRYLRIKKRRFKIMLTHPKYPFNGGLYAMRYQHPESKWTKPLTPWKHMNQTILTGSSEHQICRKIIDEHLLYRNYIKSACNFVLTRIPMQEYFVLILHPTEKGDGGGDIDNQSQVQNIFVIPSWWWEWLPFIILRKYSCIWLFVQH